MHWGPLHPIPLPYRIILHMPKYTILTMLYNTLKNYAQQLQWSREFAICLFNLSKLAKNMLGTLLIGYLYLSDMRYKIKGELFCAKTIINQFQKTSKMTLLVNRFSVILLFGQMTSLSMQLDRLGHSTCTPNGI